MKILAVAGAQGALIHRSKKYLIGNVEPRSVFHTKKEEQWKLNFGEIPFVRTLKELPENIKNIDFIVGSPSCGHSSRFSYSRKKSLGEPKEDPTLNLYIEAVLKFKPNGFLMENLPKLLELFPIKEWENVLPDYEFIAHCHPVSIFGNSQVNRKRLVLIGIKKGLPREFRKPFEEIIPVDKKELLRVAQINPRKKFNYKEDRNKKLAMYYYSDKSKRSLTVREVKKLWNGEFKDESMWPMHGHKMRNLPGVYKNRPNDYPKTLRPSNRQFNHKGYPMGLDEFRIIMGFPESYQIYFDKNDKTYWLNKGRNTFAKGSVYEVGIWFYKQLKKLDNGRIRN